MHCTETVLGFSPLKSTSKNVKSFFADTRVKDTQKYATFAGEIKSTIKMANFLENYIQPSKIYILNLECKFQGVNQF